MRRVALNNTKKESTLFRARALVVSIMVMVVFGLLLLRLYNLQITHNAHYQTLSNDNRVRVEAIPPMRGLMFDHEGILLADNKPNYRLVITPSSVDDMDALLSALSDIIAIQPHELKRFKKEFRRKQSFQKIPLVYNLSDQEVAKFAVMQYYFPGVEISASSMRHYPQGKHFAHVIGYVGRINDSDLSRLDKRDYAGTSYIGKLGLERKYESVLHGEVGYKHVEINAQGRPLRVLKTQSPIQGMDLQLSLHQSLQMQAQTLLEGRKGAIVAMDPNNGDILAFASQPTYNPNLFVNGIGRRAYSQLRDDPDQPLFNRALLGQYPPGSTIKPVVAMAALEYQIIAPEQTMYAGPHFKLPGNARKYRDWRKEGHGIVDMSKAIAQSCDVYFYSVGHQMGIDNMHQFLSKFGLGQLTGIDTVGEIDGLLPSRKWKVNTRGEAWYPGETVITSIGQGYMLTTPLQLALMTSYLATQGRTFQPRMVKAMRDVDEGDWQPITPIPLDVIEIDDLQHWQVITQAMKDAVHKPYGTAKSISQGLSYNIAGKTGTAQVFSIAQDAMYDEENVPENLRDHSLFVAFAPAENPQIALAVIVENGGSGSATAAPISRQLIDTYLNKGQIVVSH